MSIASASGGQSTIWLTSRTPSSSSTTTGAYGASPAKPGCMARAATVQVKMRPRPLERCQDHAALPQRAQISRGTWRHVPHASQRWNRSSPLAHQA